MFMHSKRLMYTVRVGAPDPHMANLILEQFGGADGKLATAVRYFTQGLADGDPGRKDLLRDIATEELSHLEVVGSIVVMLNKGVKTQMAEDVGAAELMANITGGTDSHTTALLYGGGVALSNSAGMPWTGAYVDSRTELSADLRSNIAAEACAKIIYERLINLCDDPDVKNALGFLMTREIAHQKSFEKALYAIEGQFPRASCPASRNSPTATSTCPRARATCAAPGSRASNGSTSTTGASRPRSMAATAQRRCACPGRARRSSARCSRAPCRTRTATPPPPSGWATPRPPAAAAADAAALDGADAAGLGCGHAPVARKG
jgi:Mn-containing catalase